MIRFSDRIARLRERCLQRKRQSWPDWTIVDCESFQQSESVDSLALRIGGYTDYFTRLSPAMQDEVMQRAGFDAF